MENSIVSINRGKDTLLKCPTPPIYLSDEAKIHYKKMGNYLAKRERLKDIYLSALEIYADAMAQWQFSIKSIKESNKIKPGTGYIQTYKTGAKNVSVEITLKDKAEDSILKCCKIFGLDPKSEKELKSDSNPGQMDLFAELLKLKNG
jgi:P27 family predicted phage terminase small subunit